MKTPSGIGLHNDEFVHAGFANHVFLQHPKKIRDPVSALYQVERPTYECRCTKLGPERRGYHHRWKWPGSAFDH